MNVVIIVLTLVSLVIILLSLVIIVILTNTSVADVFFVFPSEDKSDD